MLHEKTGLDDAEALEPPEEPDDPFSERFLETDDRVQARPHLVAKALEVAQVLVPEHGLAT